MLAVDVERRRGVRGSGFADPDMEALRQKVNEMTLNGLR
jgi:hypothetical protein